ncbi:MAG: hypothetical protein KKA60_08175, partial [Proteobacteria bacterium]|nr:hypothetical protein [Pseudomonadota bacterium]
MSFFDLVPVKPTLAERAASAVDHGRHWARIALMAAKNGPGPMSRFAQGKDWMKQMARANVLLDMVTCTRSGDYRKANALAAVELVAGFGDLIGALATRPDRVVIHEDLIPPEILFAMDLA